jgi:hypothetical protein
MGQVKGWIRLGPFPVSLSKEITVSIKTSDPNLPSQPEKPAMPHLSNQQPTYTSLPLTLTVSPRKQRPQSRVQILHSFGRVLPVSSYCVLRSLRLCHCQGLNAFGCALCDSPNVASIPVPIVDA